MTSRDEGAISSALVAIGKALSSGDAERVAEFWDLPGLVLADEGARVTETREEVAAFFGEAVRAYRAKGTPTAVTWLSDRLAAVSVDWLGLDADHVERTRESSYYVVRLGDDGVARIHVAPHGVRAMPQAR